MCKLCIKSLAELLGFVIQKVYVAKDSYRYGRNTPTSVSSVVEFPGAGLGRLRTINSELNGAT